ncbi:hypothetical protein [Arcobacter porcinus]|uniref:hypothetical protein n=1 Tax=Arcobacter porcinus TaxID=1935204 RepID=UPI00082569CC|nr:hypothetical protein [Arcobacter porcinus]
MIEDGESREGARERSSGISKGLGDIPDKLGIRALGGVPCTHFLKKNSSPTAESRNSHIFNNKSILKDKTNVEKKKKAKAEAVRKHGEAIALVYLLKGFGTNHI